MLQTLRIRQLLIVEDLTVEFSPGLNVLTGETGAGKSILVDALGLIAGNRADRSLVRSGAEQAVVEALFEVGPGSPILDWARRNEQEELIDEGQLLIRRELSAAGGGRIRINGSPCTLGMLREWGERLLELHGQHEHQSLLSGERHLELLDEFGVHGAARERVAKAHARVLVARERYADLDRAARDRAQRLEELEMTLREIEAVNPAPGELAELDRERNLLRNASRVSELLEGLVRLTHEGETNASSLAATASRQAAELAEIVPDLQEVARRLDSAALELQDLGSSLRDYRDRVDFEPGRLEAVEERRVALERLCLRFGPDEPAILEHRDAARGEIESLRGIDAELENCRESLRDAEEDYLEAAEKLGSLRAETSGRLGGAVEEQLESLALKKARLQVELSPARGETVQGRDGRSGPLNVKGVQRAAFLFAANPGEPFSPLERAASGGELSRLMLALHALVDGAGEGRVLVFDEVDAGVGGAVADAVGARLSRLARSQQVLCVTHLPQVAVYGDLHLVVEKSVRGGRTRAGIISVAGEARIAELARMLGGKRTTATSRRHAGELLEAAGRTRSGRGKAT